MAEGRTIRAARSADTEVGEMDANEVTGPNALDSIRARVGSLLAEQRFAEAEPLVANLLLDDPDDVLTLNQMALVSEQRGDGDGAAELSRHVLAIDPTNQIALNRLRRLGGSQLAPVHRRMSSGDRSGGVWTLKEAFPYVDSLLDEMTRGHDDWVLWIDVRDALLADDSAALAIEHWAAQQRRPPRVVASMIMAHWNASITNGRNEYDYKYERRPDLNAYRRRSKGH